MGASVGRDVLIEFAIADENASVGSLPWQVLGMMRDKGIKVTWDKVDTTADKSPQFTKTNLVTFKQVEFSGGGVSYSDAVHNQKVLKAHIYNPGSVTANQPKAWVRQTEQDGSTTFGPFIFSEWNSSSPYADVCSWQMSAMSNGAVVYTPT